jgi:hypothetical protein
MSDAEELRLVADSIELAYPYQAMRLRDIADRLDGPPRVG